MVRARGVGMEQAAIALLLGEQRTVTLATIGPGGLPHLASMWFARDGEDLLMWTYGTSQKARNLERDPRASVLAESGDCYDELCGVCLECRVRIVRAPAEVLALGRKLHGRNAPGAPGGDPGAAARLLQAQAAKRIGLVLAVERVRSWDHRRLPART